MPRKVKKKVPQRASISHANQDIKVEIKAKPAKNSSLLGEEGSDDDALAFRVS